MKNLKYFIFIGGLTLLSLGMLALGSRVTPGLFSLGLIAYTLGLRHALDADHIAAIDNTVRNLVADKKPSEAVGLYFSLGHSTIVLVMSMLATLSLSYAKTHLHFFVFIFGNIGTTVSISFLLIISIINIQALAKARQKGGEVQLSGFITRLVQPILSKIKRQEMMYAVGFLFGLGFDTATEIALLTMSSSLAERNSSLIGSLSLPFLFMAGMALVDMIDSLISSSAYQSMAKNQQIRRFYMAAVTAFSAGVGLILAFIELGGMLGLQQILPDTSHWGELLFIAFAAILLASLLFRRLTGLKNR